MNSNFHSALNGVAQKTPPIWFMRQAGRYHSHYQALRKQHSFEDLCRRPELAAQVALGPIMDFDFDVSILFSDLLFPLDAMGLGLSYSDKGPHLEKKIKTAEILPFHLDESLQKLMFQQQALKATREVLPKNKSLIGFVGGLWTLYTYAKENSHAGALSQSKQDFFKDQDFLSKLNQLMMANIQLQLDGGAEVVMVFDTSVGEVSPLFFQQELESYLVHWAEKFPGKLVYYSRGTFLNTFSQRFRSAPWLGFGFDHKNDLPYYLQLQKRGSDSKKFYQGNFDQTLMLIDDEAVLKKYLTAYLDSFRQITAEERARWVCGLGHGMLPQIPEKNVRLFVETTRKVFG